MFWVSPRPSSGVYNCINSLWFYRWIVVVAAFLVVFWPVDFFGLSSVARIQGILV
jgi:hypothetical protein